MLNIQDRLTEYENLLNQKEKELLEKQNEVLEFIDTEHASAATQKYQKDIRKTEAEINNFACMLVEAKEKNNDFRKEAEKLCTHAMNLKLIIRDISNDLANDLTQRQRTEDKKTIDLIKIVGFVAALPVVAVNIAKNTIDPDSAHSTLWSGMGAVAGVGLVFYKKIGNSIKISGSAACSTQRKIKNSFALFYIKETVIEKTRAILPWKAPSIPVKAEKSKKDNEKLEAA